jgi:hypothetical protein
VIWRVVNISTWARGGDDRRHKTRAMFDRYSIASTKDIEAALRKATLPAGNAAGQRETQ